jgi:gamma-glutamylcyclotransferase
VPKRHGLTSRMPWTKQSRISKRTQLDKLLYFSYGSNMSTPRIKHRIESATVISTARLYEHSLRFHKKSVDGSAKCDIMHTKSPVDIVHGVVFEILAREKHILDRYEGLGSGYNEKQLSIILPHGKSVRATTYYATHIDASLSPYHWYKEHVLRGAREHALPAEYIAAIEAIASVPDPDQDNHVKELSIYSVL